MRDPEPAHSALYTIEGGSSLIRRITIAVLATAFCVSAPVAHATKRACMTGGLFVATSYGPPWGGINGGGVTANGTALSHNPRIYGVAADTQVLRLGARVRIWPNPFHYRGRFKVFDTGSAIRGTRIDFYDWRGRSKQYGWGARRVRVCR